MKLRGIKLRKGTRVWLEMKPAIVDDEWEAWVVKVVFYSPGELAIELDECFQHVEKLMVKTEHDASFSGIWRAVTGAAYKKAEVKITHDREHDGFVITAKIGGYESKARVTSDVLSPYLQHP